MESETKEITQAEITNIARKANVRGQVASLYNLRDMFATFVPKVVKKEDILSAIDNSIKDLLEGEPL